MWDGKPTEAEIWNTLKVQGWWWFSEFYHYEQSFHKNMNYSSFKVYLDILVTITLFLHQRALTCSFFFNSKVFSLNMLLTSLWKIPIYVIKLAYILSQVNFICKTHHKSQICQEGFTICTALQHPVSLDPLIKQILQKWGKNGRNILK